MNRVTLWRISVGVLLFASAPAFAQERTAFSWPPPAEARARLTWRNPEIPPVIVQVVSATNDTLRYVPRKDASVVSIGVNSLARRPPLKALRLTKGHTLMALSEQTGIGWTLLSKYERDVIEPKYRSLIKVIRVLGVGLIAVDRENDSM